jgi:hypothetical protein
MLQDLWILRWNIDRYEQPRLLFDLLVRWSSVEAASPADKA